MPLSNITRRSLLATLRDSGINWAGDIAEDRFLGRLYDLVSMPSTDQRCDNASQDISLHRIANYDWDDDWIFGDDRLNLDRDEKLLDLLAESLHPEVRFDEDEGARVCSILNTVLQRDGVELFQRTQISGHPVYGWRPYVAPVATPRQLREAIGEAIRANMSANDVADFCQATLGLESQEAHDDHPMAGKRAYVVRRLNGMSLDQLVAIADDVVTEFGDSELASVLDSVRSSPGGVAGDAKNIIFAARGPKPRLVLIDALNNDVQITRHADRCLVYNRALGPEGLSWESLIDWWREIDDHGNDRDTGLSLHRRLLESLDAGPEQLILGTYAKLYRDYGFQIPALVPQVYLHYDPANRSHYAGPGPLARQRMDFLLLLPRRRRVVIELDGKRHYANENTRLAQTLRGDGKRGSPPSASRL